MAMQGILSNAYETKGPDAFEGPPHTPHLDALTYYRQTIERIGDHVTNRAEQVVYCATVDVQISRLRKSLTKCGDTSLIRTVRGAGARARTGISVACIAL